ncbi:hypothetical protein BDW62DRAFT_195606 [Aspergillus aurantiobrunneus]
MELERDDGVDRGAAPARSRHHHDRPRSLTARSIIASRLFMSLLSNSRPPRPRTAAGQLTNTSNNYVQLLRREMRRIWRSASRAGRLSSCQSSRIRMPGWYCNYAWLAENEEGSRSCRRLLDALSTPSCLWGANLENKRQFMREKCFRPIFFFLFLDGA